MRNDYIDGRQTAEVTKSDNSIEIILYTEKPYSMLILTLWVVVTAVIILFGFDQIEILLDRPGQIFVSDDSFKFAAILAVDFIFIYPLCVLIFNKTIIHVDQDRFTVRHTPLWIAGTFSIPISEITKIKVVEEEERIRVRRSFHSHKMIFYFLVLVSPTGKHKKINTLKSSEAMLSFVKEQLLSWFHGRYEKKQEKLGIWGKS